LSVAPSAAAPAVLQGELAANERAYKSNGAEPRGSRAAGAGLSAQQSGSNVASKTSEPAEQTPEQEPAKAEDLLGAANALRAERRYAEALEKYTAVLRVYPRSAQARAARVAAATLRLERLNDAKGARELLSEATNSDVAMAGAGSGKTALPEAEFALAEAHRAAGDSAAERSALLRFVKRYPDHPLFTVAERRLQELQRLYSHRNSP
jgi:tetratricopeptide (TPR) repeat protein